MAITWTFNEGHPDYDWQGLLQDVLENGTFQGTTGSPINLQTGGGVVLRIVGTSLTSDGARHITGGSIDSFELIAGDSSTVFTFAYDTSLSFSDLQTVLDNPSDLDPFVNDSINAIGSDDGDTIVGNVGADEIHAGDGQDTLIGGDAADVLDGGDGGNDLVDYSNEGGGSGVVVNLELGTATDTFGNTDTLSGIEEVFGTSQNDTIIGTDNAGNTWFDNGLRGLEGADTIDGQGGFDIAFYDSDVDFGGTAGITANLQTGTVIDGFGDTDSISGIEGIRGTMEADSFTGKNNDDVNYFTGLDGGDTVTGGTGSTFTIVDYAPESEHGATHGILANLSGAQQTSTVDATVVDDGKVVDAFGALDTLTNVDMIRGTEFADEIWLGGATRFFAGIGGDDIVHGFVGGDNFATDNDIVLYNNDANYGGGSGVVVNLQTGSATDGFGNTDTLSDIETVVGTDSDDDLTGDAQHNQLEGNGGDDVLIGGAGNDTLIGGYFNGVDFAGRDTVDYGREESDNPGPVHGVIVNLSGSGITTDGAFSSPGVLVAAGHAFDTYANDDTLAFITSVIGTSLNDYMVGNNVRNDFDGSGGNDWLIGGDGENHLGGGDGNDTLIGGSANTGDSNSDFIAPGSGNDTIHAGGPFDDGYDNLEYYDAPNGIHVVKTNHDSGTVTNNGAPVGLGVGTDTFDGIEIVVGSDHNDVFDGSGEDDDFTGNAGADVFNGGDGRDTVVYDKESNRGPFDSGTEGVIVNLSGGGLSNVSLTALLGSHGLTAPGDFATLPVFSLTDGHALDSFGDLDTLNSIERAIGTQFTDIMVGNADELNFQGREGDDILIAVGGNNANLEGEDGNDILIGNDNNNDLEGGNDNDLLIGGAGENHFRGGDGDDVLIGSRNTNGGSDFFRGGGGDDEVHGSAGVGDDQGYDNLEYYDAENGIHVHKMSRDSGTVDDNGAPFNGGIGTDTFDGVEIVVGSDFADIFDGSTDDDDFTGNAGADTFNGDDGIDRVVYDKEADRGPDSGTLGVVVNVSGSDFNDGSLAALLGGYGLTPPLPGFINLVSSAPGTGHAFDSFGNLDTLASIEHFTGTQYGDVFLVSGDYAQVEARDGDDVLISFGGDNTDHGGGLDGGAGDDILIGSAGKDYLDAGRGNDIVLAGGGEFDNIHGSSGTDFVDGQGGFDMIAFQGNNPADHIHVILNHSGDGNGTVSGEFDGEIVATTFTNVERVTGTFGDDSFVANPGFHNTDDASGTFFDGRGDNGRAFELVGGHGSDSFTDLSGVDGGVTMVNYDEEKWSHQDYDGGHNWGDEGGENGVIVNLSASTLLTVASGQALDTFGDTDTINGVQTFRLTDADDHFFAGNTGVYVEGHGGDDELVGGSGADILNGDDGNDTIHGGGGKDNLSGWTGDDHIFAEGGDDYIRGGIGDADTADGGTGFDVLGFGNIDGNGPLGHGIDVVLNNSGAGGGAITGDIADGSTTGLVNTTFVNAEYIEGTNGADTFAADAGFVNTSEAWRPFTDDRGDLRGQGGAFIVVGGGGADTFTDNTSGELGGSLVVVYDQERWTHSGYDGHVWGVDNSGEHGVIVNLSGSDQSVAGFDLNDGDADPPSILVTAHHAFDTFGSDSTTIADLDHLVGIQAVTLTNLDDWFWADDTLDSVVYGNEGTDHLFGGAGDDEFIGGKGADEIDGGSGGFDLIDYGRERDLGASDTGITVNLSGADQFGLISANAQSGQAFDSYLFVDTLSNIDGIIGTGGTDTIYGGVGSNGGLNDGMLLVGLGGSDLIVGGGNGDTILGGAANDTLSGGGGADHIEGGAGDDLIDGEAGADTVLGDAGDDTVAYDGGDTSIDGGTDVDTLVVNATISLTIDLAATIVPGDQAPTDGVVVAGFENVDAIGSTASVTLIGDAGDNILAGGSAGDVINGGTGHGARGDTVSYATSTTAVSINLGTNSASGGYADGDSLSNIQNIIGSDDGLVGDSLTGDANNNIFTGGAGGDTIDGGAGIDVSHYDATLASGDIVWDTDHWEVSVGADTDTLTNIEIIEHTGGRYLLVAPGGDDTGGFAGLVDAILHATQPTDTILFAVPPGTIEFNASVDAPGHVDDSFNINIPYNIPVNITLGNGNSTITTGDGADVIIVGSGNNTIHTGGGNDVVVTGTGNNTIVAGQGAGDDIYDGTLGSPTVEYPSASNGISVYLTAIDRSLHPTLGSFGASTVGDLLAANLYTSTMPVGLVEGSLIDTDVLIHIENVTGGPNSDLFVPSVVDGLDNILDGAGGTDTIDYSLAPESLTIDLTTGSVTGDGTNLPLGSLGIGTDTISNFEFITAGTGDDTFIVAVDNIEHDLDGNDGNDTADYSAYSTSLNVWLNGSTAAGVGGSGSGGSPANDFISNIENFTGGSGDDTITGDGLANVLKGGGGDDTIIGGGASDNDTVVFTGDWKDYDIQFGAGTYTVTDLRDGSPDGTDTVTNVEFFQFANGTFEAADVLNDTPDDITLTPFSVNENAPDLTVVGTLSATDLDTPLDDTAIFALLDDAGGRFALSGTSIIVADGSLLDYEDVNSHDITVRVTDSHGAQFERQITIDLNDVNEAPSLGGGGNSVGYTEQTTALVVDSALTVADPEDNLNGATVIITAGLLAGDTLSFVDPDGVGGISGSYVAATGTLTLSGAASLATYQTALRSVTYSSSSDNPTNFGAALTRTITWHATDTGALGSNNQTSTINITPLNDNPSVTSSPTVGVAENALAVTTVTSTDVDTTNVGRTFGVVGGADGAKFTINSAGVLSFITAPDFENPADVGANNTYNLIVRVSDGAGGSADQAVSVSVSNVLGNTISGTKAKDTVDATHAIAGKVATIEEDTITGLAGNDTLKGLAGNDLIDGGKGDDKLYGGLGRDTLTGGKGKDGFYFDSALGSGNVDTIVGFKHADDSLYLSRSVFSQIGSGKHLKATAFYKAAGAVAAHDANDRIVYNKTDGGLWYDADGKGGAAAVEFAIIDKHPGNVDASDFLIVA